MCISCKGYYNARKVYNDRVNIRNASLTCNFAKSVREKDIGKKRIERKRERRDKIKRITLRHRKRQVALLTGERDSLERSHESWLKVYINSQY